MKSNCLICKKEFTTFPCKIKRGRGKYCSKPCKFLGTRRRQYRRCLVCHKEFWAFRSNIKRREVKYCSQRCYQIIKDKRKQQECQMCDKTFLPFSYQTKRGYGKYCSRGCWDSFRRGEHDHYVRGGLTLLARQLRKTVQYTDWRKKCLERDKYSCQDCGREDNLNVDHIIPFTYLLKKLKIMTIEVALGMSVLWQLSNGNTLCAPCHRQKDTYGMNTVYYREVINA